MFSLWESFSAYIIFELLDFDSASHLGKALHFFLFDTIKIFVLLIAIVYAVTLLRSYFPIERVRDYISGKNRIVGHIFAALFGMLTPFCSCSAIPLFLGFLQARIPLGVTFSYLISAPLSDAVVIALLFSLFGLKITLLYIGFSLTIAIVAGLIIGSLKLEKEVLLEVKATCCSGTQEVNNQTLFKLKMSNAWNDTMDIFKQIYLYVIVGIAIGAFIHGYVPTDFITKYAGGDVWYAPIVAVIMGIPMYSSAAGMLPLIEVLTQKGMLLGTALSFMMAVVALSLPEAMILKKVLSTKLIVIFFTTVGSAILFVGFIFNMIL
ncbi:hypothetical protein M947_08940 [Sulfurimonas hongkongensis]|uniref:Permease n=1 Tax=Sulfurimonas hongkongensis TaxID=1172190 RepID=T0KQ39_9BACT|nr:permease [Sulfurimonas hongkongensis]EQB35398.1 hypothetical protein M947_08940 [Sulfurimonas hongkongensis]